MSFESDRGLFDSFSLPLVAKGSRKGLEERVRLVEKFEKGDEDEEDMIAAEDELIRVSMGTESQAQITQ